MTTRTADEGLCPSWLHDEPTSTLPGRRVCAAHLEDEMHMVRVEQQLQRVAEEIRAYEADLDRHPDKAKDFLESAVRWFLDQDLEPLGHRAAVGYRRSEQLDVITTLDAAAKDAWSIDLRVRRGVENAQLAMHVEIAYRATGSDVYSKVRSDLQKLNRSIDQAIEQGHALPWTALVLLGPAWTNRQRGVMQLVHSAYHNRSMDRLDEHTAWWPIVDAVVMPHVLYKKHDFFKTQELTGDKLPVMVPTPSDALQLRPLAIARGLIVHRTHVLEGRAKPDGETWPDSQMAAILGPNPTLPGRALGSLEDYTAVGMWCSDQPPEMLWNMGSDYPRAVVVPMPFELSETTCNLDRQYLYEPVPFEVIERD